MKKGEVTGLKKKLADTEAQLEATRSEWMQTLQAQGQALADAMERKKLEKIQSIIGHITAGRQAEAIQALLEPVPVVISMDICFADVHSREKYEEEMLAKMVEQGVTALRSLRIHRNGNHQAKESQATV